MTIKEQTYYIIADRIIGKDDSKIYVDWAVEMILIGHETENILILAGLDDSDTEEREMYFQEALNDLEIEYPYNNMELINMYSINLANKVILKQISPQIGLDKMTELFHTSDYSNKFSAFTVLSEDIDCIRHSGQPLFNSGLRDGNIDKFIVNEFRLFIETQELEDKSLIEKAKCKKCGALIKPELKLKWSWRKFKRLNYNCCPKCSSLQLVLGNSQEGKRIIIDEIKRITH